MDGKQRFERFMRELTALSKQYGVVIESTGGVHVLADAEAAARVAYSRDASSGDLSFTLEGAYACHSTISFTP